MNRFDSLTEYFEKTNALTLDNCDREQIHLSNAIQPIGALLALSIDGSRVVAASANAATMLNLSES